MVRIMKIIKLIKYPNRKIYAPKGEVGNTARYVNLTEIASFIRQGNTIRVLKHREETDLTNEVLREILLDQKIKLSTEDLHSIIEYK
jgi:polyhydroxyalkanoate synthesis regulator protein